MDYFFHSNCLLLVSFFDIFCISVATEGSEIVEKVEKMETRQVSDLFQGLEKK